MGYYRNLMKDMRKQFGAALDARGLVMRGQDHGDEMEFFFVKASDESWRSTVRLFVDGRSSTARNEATWADVSMIASEVTVEKIGQDWTVYNVTDDYGEENEGSDADFIHMVNAHFIELEAVPWTTEWRPGVLSWSASNAFNAMHSIVTGYGLPAAGISYERDGARETLICVDGEGKEFKFVCPLQGSPKFYVDGKPERCGDDRHAMLLAVDRYYVPPAGHEEHYIRRS